MTVWANYAPAAAPIQAARAEPGMTATGLTTQGAALPDHGN
jgi:hypothetical protein